MKPNTKQQQKIVNNWNAKHRPGTAVILRRDNGQEQQTTTRSEAELLSGHTAVVWLDGISSCYSLDRCRAV